MVNSSFFRNKGFVIFFGFLILLSLTSYDAMPQATCPGCGCGDSPLDEETYQQFLKPVYEDDGLERDSLPTAYDARDDNIVTPAKNQQSCGGCWAFASAGAMESHLLKADLPFSPTDISEQQQLSCNSDMLGCCGGSSTALRFWETIGPVYDPCYPFGDGAGVPNCPNEPYSNISCTSSCPQLEYRVTGYYTVLSSQYKDSLYEDGPSYWRFDVYEDFMDFYSDAASGSVYTQTTGSKLGGHAVLIIGWDDAKGAYLCKNSWGSTSGPQDDGTFWISYSGHAHNLNIQMANFEILPLNQAPIANAGPDQAVTPGELVTLNGSGSYDPDGDTPITYQWTQTLGTTVTLSSATLSTPTFTSPASPGKLTFRLVVTDSEGLPSSPDYVNIYNGVDPVEVVYLPLIMGSANPIINGNFEQGRVGWAEYSSGGYILLYGDQSWAQSGSWLAYLGGYNNALDYISQSFTVPASQPYLHFYYYIDSEDYCIDPVTAYDYGFIVVNETTLAYAPLCETYNSTDWSHYALNLSAYAGKKVSLRFQAETDVSLPSDFYVDTVFMSASSSYTADTGAFLQGAPIGVEIQTLSEGTGFRTKDINK